MGRFVLIRDGEHVGERMVEESAVPTEAALHEVLMRNPGLVPATDLGFGNVVTVGFEASLASGSADLVLLDDAGRVCIVEVKKAGNPDTRRVVAQLIDYAAALWGVSLDDFEQAVLRRRLGEHDSRGLREFIVEELVAGAEDPEEAADRTIEGLSETLRSGDFALVLAAPTIPDGVQRNIEYLNARGLSVFGLEVSYFAGAVEAFVPRIVVRPSLGTRIAGQDTRRPSTPIAPDTFLETLPEQARPTLAKFIATIEGDGGELDWKQKHVRIRVRGNAGPKVAVTVDAAFFSLLVIPMKGLDPRHAAAARTKLGQVAGIKVGREYASLRLSNATEEQIAAAAHIARAYVRDLAGGEPDTNEGGTPS